MMNILTMKFGGSCITSSKSFLDIADIIIERKKEYPHLVVVVSAMGGMTDTLIKLAKEVNISPSKREQDMLISVGERISISLLAMAMEKKKKKAISFTGSQSGIITCCMHSNARIVDIKPKRILKELKKKKVVIVAGFQGMSTAGEITTLGRGGADTSAVALAVALQAKKVEFYKDVKGIYSKDPKKEATATFLPNLCYSEAEKIIEKGAEILHLRALKLAEKNEMLLHILPNEKVGRKEKKGTIIKGKKKRGKITPIYEEVC